MAGNPSFMKREKERRRQERQRQKMAERQQRKQDRAKGVVPPEDADAQAPPVTAGQPE